MKNNYLFVLFFIASIGFSQSKLIVAKSKLNIPKTTKKVFALRNQHEQNLTCSPFAKTLQMSKSERKGMGIPPDKYYEHEWELTMNPVLGYPTTDKVKTLREDLELKRKLAMLQRTPGDAFDNSWVDRGPTNVGGRTRALLFDPNDPTDETVFAGSVSGGLWKNTNISNPNSAWSLVNIPENLTVSCIAVDPNNSSIFYLGTGESYTGDVSGDGVWKSIDAGTTWSRVLGGIGNTTVFNSAAPMTVNSPVGVSGNYNTIPTTAFGSSLSSPITSNLVLVSDGTSAPTEGCSPPLINPSVLSGKIALIRRGNCAFVVKVLAAQDAGAIAVVMMNNVAGTPAGMGGADPSITIPSFAISQADGNLLEASLNAGNTISATLNPALPGQFTGYNVPGIQTINDIKIRNNGGTSEVYVAVGDTYNYAYIGANNFGLYKSTNAGATWSAISLPTSPSGNKTCPNDIAIGADNKIWLSSTNSSTFGDGGGKIFSSNDGTNFTLRHTIARGDRVQIAASSTVADKLYVLSELSQVDTANPTIESTILKTTNGFATTPTTVALPVDAEPATRFTTYGFTGQQAFYDLLLEINPLNDEEVYVGGIDLFKSSNGGVAWTQIGHWTGAYAQYVHSDQHGVAFGKNDVGKLLFGNDGGVYYSSNSGTTITARNKGYNVTQFYSVAVAPANSGLVGDYFVSGAQDNGTQYFGGTPAGITAGANQSTQVQGGDGATCLFDQGTDKYYITNYVYNDNVNSRNASTGTLIKTLSDGTANSGAFIAPMALDSNRDMLYSDFTTGTTYQIRRYTNVKSVTATVRTNLTNALLTASPTALTVSKYTTTTTKLYVGTRNSKILLLTNANATPTWTDISAGSGMVGSVSDIELGANEAQIFVTMHNYGVVSIWYTADAGATWENKEGNLPDMPVKCILQNPLNAEEVIIGTDLGVWFTNNFSATSPNWRQSYNGMRNVKVTDLDLKGEANGATAYSVYASTFGRGVFSGLFTAIPLSNQSFTLNSSVKIAPNPSNGIFNISIGGFTGKVNIKVVDINGRLIIENKDIDFNLEKSIDLGRFQSGMYILKIDGDNLNFSTKLIKN